MRQRIAHSITPLTRNTRVLLEAVLLGLAVGILATLYRLGINHFTHGFRRVFHLFPQWAMFLMPVLGALCLVGILRLFRAQVQDYVPEIIETSIRQGALRFKDGIVCLLTSLLTLSSGGSAGPEGPMAFAGAATGSLFGKLVGLDRRRAKVFLAAGTAAGIAAIFNAPIAGVLFALELILLNDLTMSAVTPVILASVSASTINYYYMGSHPTFVVPPFAFRDYLELFAYAFLGVLGGVVSVVFIRLMALVHKLFLRISSPVLRPLAGALAVGILLIFLPQAGGYGHDYITRLLEGQLTLAVILCLVFIKMLATALTLGSGNSGGIFAPSLLVGASLGAGMGGILNLGFPGIGPVTAYATVGMAAVMAGTIQAPLTAMMLIFEVTYDYHIMLPLMTATVISTAVAYGLGADSIYLEALSERRLDFRRIRDLGALADVHARDLMDSTVPRIRDGEDPAELLEQLRGSGASQALLVSAGGELRGLICPDAPGPAGVASPPPRIRRDVPTVRLSETIYHALATLRETAGCVVVVDDRNRPAGVISDQVVIEKLLPLLEAQSDQRSKL